MDKTRTTSLQVLVASENSELRDQITKLVEQEPGVKVVGQARNAVEAMGMAKSLRPEVTMVDPYLPYQLGLDGVPLSRMSGLDAAVSMAEELPSSIAVLVSNPNLALFRDYRMDAKARLCRYTEGFCVPLSLRQFHLEAAPAERMVFADFWVEETAPARNKALELSDQLITYGILALIFGFASFLTIVGVFAGIVLAGIGLVAILVGLAIKRVARCLPGSACDADTPE